MRTVEVANAKGFGVNAVQSVTTIMLSKVSTKATTI